MAEILSWNLRLVGPDGEWLQYLAELDSSLRGRWIEVRLMALEAKDLRLRIGKPSDDPSGQTIFYSFREISRPRGASGGAFTVLYIPPDAVEISIDVRNRETGRATVEARIEPLGKFRALVRLMKAADPSLTRSAIKGNLPSLPNRLRDTLANALKWTEVGLSYSRWVRRFDTWGEERILALRGRLLDSPEVRFAVALFCQNPESNASQASLEALAATGWTGPIEVIDPLRDSTAIAWPEGTEFVAIVQAGELISPHAFVALKGLLKDDPDARAIYADEDVLRPEFYRDEPLFKPQPGQLLMASGILSRGVWFVKPNDLSSVDLDVSCWAETLRMEIGFRLAEAGLLGKTYRFPGILTHRRWDTESAPLSALADVARGHFDRTGRTVAIDESRFPLDVRMIATRFEKVAIIIPTSARKPHVEGCLEAILTFTRYESVEFLIVVTQIVELDEEQKRILARASQDPRVRILVNRAPSFNFSQANNFAAGKSESAYICLLNDDIRPLSQDWLETLMGPMMDPRIGIVGAKLLFENLTVQHAGVVVGIDGCCGHTFVRLPGHEPGYAFRAVIDQEYSAVTGACMLTRRGVYERVGGLDESFPSAYNDIDYCLRVGEHGFQTVWSAHARLIHLETVSFGTHYSNDQADRQVLDRDRFRERWLKIILDDPFHNPNLTKAYLKEWSHAVPPPDLLCTPKDDGY